MVHLIVGSHSLLMSLWYNGHWGSHKPSQALTIKIHDTILYNIQQTSYFCLTLTVLQEKRFHKWILFVDTWFFMKQCFALLVCLDCTFWTEFFISSYLQYWICYFVTLAKVHRIGVSELCVHTKLSDIHRTFFIQNNFVCPVSAALTLDNVTLSSERPTY